MKIPGKCVNFNSSSGICTLDFLRERARKWFDIASTKEESTLLMTNLRVQSSELSIS